MQNPQRLISEDELQHRDRDLNWCTWLAVLLFGFICGATAVLLAFWLFHNWLHPRLH